MTGAVLAGWRERVRRTPSHEEAFSAVVAGHVDELTRFAYVLCGDRMLAEDAVAEAFTKAWPRFRRGEIDVLPAYVRRSVVNEVYRRARRLKLERREAERHHPPPPDGRFDDRVGHGEAIWPLVARLPLRHRMVVVLRVVEDLSESETADILGIPPGTVKSRLSRSLTALRTMVEDDDG